ncbi:MAG TPA: peptidase P60 [Phenylobacterium sp.]|nr:peptidase P60 [Phenylobacterium sp.]
MRRLRILPRATGEDSKERIVAAARSWIGTPYRHQSSAKGAGCDCLGLVRGIWREVVGPEPEAPPPYAPDWAEVGGRETLLEAARRWLVEIPPAGMAPGDVALFRMAAGAPVKHCAIVSALGPPQPRIVHAYWGRAVVESWLGPWWARRLTHVFRFPPCQDLGEA